MMKVTVEGVNAILAEVHNNIGFKRVVLRVWHPARPEERVMVWEGRADEALVLAAALAQAAKFKK